MATVNAINANTAGLVYYDGAGGFTGFPLTDGQVVIGDTGTFPVANTLTPGPGIGIINGTGSITISALTFTNVTGTTQLMLTNHGYLANNAALVTLTLPGGANQFDIIEVKGVGAGGWQIAQNAGQQIIFGNLATTIGVGGSLASTNANDGVRLMLVSNAGANIWSIIYSLGNVTVV